MSTTNNNEFHGIIPYLVSPLDHNTGRVKKRTLDKLINNLIDEGVHGISPLGSTGEVHYLSWKQKIEIVKVTLEIVNKRIPVIPGVTAYTPHEAIEQINLFKEMGVDGVVLILNTYFPLKKENIINFFKIVNSNVSCPIVLYNNPQFSNVDLTPEIVIELSKLDNITYFKDATGNTGRLLSVINNSSKDSIRVFSASAHIPLFVIELGGVGWMAGPACLFPKQSVCLYQLIKLKRFDEAMDLQKKMWKVNEVFKKYNLSSCIKNGLEIQGYDVGKPILPLTPLNDKEIDDIKNVINFIDNIALPTI